MGKATDVAVELGTKFAQSKEGKATIKGAIGVVGIGAGTALETAGALVGAAGAAGAGTTIAGLGYTLTGVGCAAAQTAITVGGSIPAVGGAIAGTITWASSAVFALASNPVTLAVGAGAAGVYGIYKFFRKIVDI